MFKKNKKLKNTKKILFNIANIFKDSVPIFLWEETKKQSEKSKKDLNLIFIYCTSIILLIKLKGCLFKATDFTKNYVLIFLDSFIYVLK